MRSPNQTPQDSLDLLVLKTLQRGPNHGFGITTHIQSVSDGVLRVEEGSLYPALHRLERQGYLKAEWNRTDSGRRARFYGLTAAGRKHLTQEERRWHSVQQAVGKVLSFT